MESDTITDPHRMQDASQAGKTIDEASPIPPPIFDIEQGNLSDRRQPNSRFAADTQDILVSEILHDFEGARALPISTTLSPHRSSTPPSPAHPVNIPSDSLDDEDLQSSDKKFLIDIEDQAVVSKLSMGNYKDNFSRFVADIEAGQLTAHGALALYALCQTALKDLAHKDEVIEHRDHKIEKIVKEKSDAMQQIKELKMTNITLDEAIKDSDNKIDNLQSSNKFLSEALAHERAETKKLHSELSHQQDVRYRRPDLEQDKNEPELKKQRDKTAALEASNESMRNLLDRYKIECDNVGVDVEKAVWINHILPVDDSILNSESAISDQGQERTPRGRRPEMQLRPMVPTRGHSAASQASTQASKIESGNGSPRRRDVKSVFDEVGSWTGSVSSNDEFRYQPEESTTLADGQEHQALPFGFSAIVSTSSFDKRKLSGADASEAKLENTPSPRSGFSMQKGVFRVQSNESAISPRTTLPHDRIPLSSLPSPLPASVSFIPHGLAALLPGVENDDSNLSSRRNAVSPRLREQSLQRPLSSSVRSDASLNDLLAEVLKSYGAEEVFRRISFHISAQTPGVTTQPKGDGTDAHSNSFESDLENYHPVTKIEVATPTTDIFQITLPGTQVSAESMSSQDSDMNQMAYGSLQKLISRLSDIWPEMIGLHWFDMLNHLAERAKAFHSYLSQHIAHGLDTMPSAQGYRDILQTFFEACLNNNHYGILAQLKIGIGNLNHRMLKRENPGHDLLLFGCWLATLWLLTATYFLKMDWASANSVHARREVSSWTSQHWVFHPSESLKASLLKTFDPSVEPISHFT